MNVIIDTAPQTLLINSSLMNAVQGSAECIVVPALPCRAKTGTSCCSVVNQTQVEEKETSDEETRKRNNIVGVMNERGMELFAL